MEQHRDIITGHILPDRIREIPCIRKVSPVLSPLHRVVCHE